METIISQLFENQVVRATFAAWAMAQMLKICFLTFRQKRFDFRWVIETGGMPSAHSACVAGLAAAVGLHTGFDSALFAVSLIFALITMFDAQGVRFAVGRQAILLNKILDEFSTHNEGYEARVEERLKALLGHTPIEVFAGASLGVAASFAVYIL